MIKVSFDIVFISKSYLANSHESIISKVSNNLNKYVFAYFGNEHALNLGQLVTKPGHAKLHSVSSYFTNISVQKHSLFTLRQHL